jgi:hypothetical protein
MRFQARMFTDSRDAGSVSKSLSADNICLDFLTVKTGVSGKRIDSKIECESLSTLISTVDDLLRCQISSEVML